MDYDLIRFDHDISSEDKFFVVGGYEGHVSSIIQDKYNPEIFIFEPSLKWYNFLVNKHSNGDKIKVYNYGFGSEDSTRRLYIHGTGDGSSLFFESGEYEDVKIIKMSDFLQSNNINSVKMAEFNCEGAEFEIISDLDKNGKVGVFEIIQIQYHRIDGHESLYESSTEILEKTHTKKWGGFTWECWVKK
jgi:FkbM family methyltransferase